ncbi:unnamed protein product [Amoebophrya sp. A25]|nr:unnamed protein product [Amoebophrya sp. A25]|eukprot:GSA25T00008516001.1
MMPAQGQSVFGSGAGGSSSSTATLALGGDQQELHVNHQTTSLQDVVNQIHRMHAPSGPSGAQQATQWLLAWSHHCPWESLLQLLSHAGNNKDVLSFFFAANLLAQKAQQGKSATSAIADQILEIITKLGDDQKVVRRQLCVAYADLALYGHASLEKAVQALQQSSMQGLLEMLKIFPEEVRSSKVSVDQEQRMRLINNLLMSQEQVFDALASSESDNFLKLQAAEQWLSLPTPQVIASKEAGARFTAEIIKRKCYEHPLLKLAAQSLASDSVEVGEAACGTLIALIGLTNEYNDMTAPAVELVARSCINLANILSPAVDGNGWLPYGPTSPNVDATVVRMNFVARILTELGPHFFRALVANSTSGKTPPATGERPWTDALADVALHWLTIRQVDIARGGLEFWYGTIVAQQNEAGSENKEILHPFFERFTFACLKCTRYPAVPEAHEGFETDHFVRFREQCNQCLTDAVVSILPVSWVIHVVGDHISTLHEWNDLDAALFILTGVAPRARAGQDNVIPKLIDQIPNFNYPTSGLPALILRISAGRLILYTAGYLAFKEQALVPTLNFLLGSLLPSLPKIECSDKDLKQYSQAICTDALRSTTQAAKEKLLEIDNGKFWPIVINQIVELVVNGGFHADVRPQMVFPVGHIIGAMKDHALLEQTLGQFVSKLEPQYDITTYVSREGKGPPELKLYLAGLSCCYDIKIPDPQPLPDGTMGPLQRHPVLSFWESQWERIEKLTELAVERDWEDYVEQFCLSLTFIFTSAQQHAVNSPLLIKSLSLLGRAAEHKPSVHYYLLARQVMGLFAPHGQREMDEQLVMFLGVFAQPVARLSQQKKCPPEISAACFEMLGDALRWSNLANGALQSSWLSSVFDAALDFLNSGLEIATHEQALTAALRFFCSFLRWASEGPEVVKYAKPLWEGEQRIASLTSALLTLLARCADNPKATTVGGVAEVIRPMLMGPMEFEAKQCLREGFQKLPPPLQKTPAEASKLVETMAIGKVDQKRFHKILYDIADNFHATVKRAGS